MTAQFYQDGNEVPRNLVDHGQDGWNKWIMYQGQHKSWITLSINDGKKKVRGIGFKSANDCPERDPQKAKVKFFGAGDEETVVLDTHLDF